MCQRVRVMKFFTWISMNRNSGSGQHKFLCIDMNIAHIEVANCTIFSMQWRWWWWCMSRRRLASCVKNLSQISFKRRIIYNANNGSSCTKPRDAIRFNATLSYNHSLTHTQCSMHKQNGKSLNAKTWTNIIQIFFLHFSRFSLLFVHILGEIVRFLSCNGYHFGFVSHAAASDE